MYRRVLACVLHGPPGYSVLAPGGNCLQFDEISWAVWEQLEYPQTAPEIARQLAAVFSVAPDECLGDVCELLEQLLAAGLIQPVETRDKARDRYLHLLKRALVNLLYPEDALRIRALARSLVAEGAERKPYLCNIRQQQPDAYAETLVARRLGLASGLYSTSLPYTLVGMQRLEQLERYAETIFHDGIPGDFLEAGVCRGGASIFLRALQVSFHQEQRRIWLADSFEGLPKSTAEPDLCVDLSSVTELNVSLEEVRENFAAFGLLDEQVLALKGWFQHTLPGAPVQQIALLRLDGDLYSSTMETLQALYDRVSPGGYVVVDDYNCFPMCKQAVDEYREAHGITAELQAVDPYGVGWRKPL